MPRAKTLTQPLEDADDFELDLAEGVEDDSERGPPDHIRFNITFFGADYPVETIVQRMTRNDFFIPDFQRSYVWSKSRLQGSLSPFYMGFPCQGYFCIANPIPGNI
jgi:hypothetical protein